MKITSTLIVALAISGITAEARLLGKKKSKKGGGGSSDIIADNRVPPGTVWPVDESTNVDNRVPGQSTDGDCCNGEAGPQPPSGQDSAGNRVGGFAVPESGFKPTFSVAKKGEGFSLNNYITGVPRDFECECNDQVSDICFRLRFLHFFVSIQQYASPRLFLHTCIHVSLQIHSALSKTALPRSAASNHTTSLAKTTRTSSYAWILRASPRPP